MARQEYTCTVNQAGASVGVPGTSDPAIRFMLSDAGGSFINTGFFAAETGKNQMLGVALAAIITQSQVSAFLDDPAQPVNPPGAQVYSLYILAG
jgi:hypothetical protein